MALTSELLMEKWTMLIIREAFYGVKRFEDIREDTGIPRSVLTSRLKHLVENDILKRKDYRVEGARPRPGYVLTEKGRELSLVIFALMQWGDKHLKGGDPAIEISNKADGRAIKVALVDAETEEVALPQVALKVL
ncbi:helix-turn-helix domain-containing protein [Planktotalea sp.]|uniref:winged helix-turn-helix transcriptional regulator n=1 Tax=Planktotalea sp. TaxID=2029877 RepID=UPI00329794A3